MSDVTFNCECCNEEVTISRRLYLERKRNNTPFLCKLCMSKYKSEKSIEGNKKYWNSLSDEERQERGKQMSDGWANMSDEKKQELAEISSKREKERWENKSEEDKQARIDLLTKVSKEYWDNASPEKIKEVSERLSRLKKEYWDSRTQEEMDEINKQKSIKSKRYWDSLTEEERQQKIDDIIQKMSEYLNSLTIEERKELIHNKLKASRINNNLHQKFEEYFKNSHLDTNYYILSEVPINFESNVKCWDYGIYDKKTKTLQMVIDLDGSYYHADECDYDGIHSKEEYDEKRNLFIPEGVKVCIITEDSFLESFKYMIQIMLINYKEYVEMTINNFLNMEFPYPKYTNNELIRSWKSLCNMKCDDEYHKDISLNTRLGDRLINHFHPSIYNAHRENKPSPVEAWQDPRLLRKCIENRIIYQNYLNPNKIVQGFNICKIAPKVSVFSAGRAKLLIYKYLNNYNEIFDPFSGFSGRMLGALSLNKKYIGQDISNIHVDESNALIHFLKDNNCLINASVSIKDIFTSFGTYECLFTCSPYENKEKWENKIINLSCDNWIDECIQRFKCKKYLFVVNNTKKYKKYIVDTINNKSHFNVNNEYVILIE